MNARRRQHEFLASSDPERTLLEHLAELNEPSDLPESRWHPGTPLKLLLAGYSGAGNVGTEMRTGEIVRQLRHLLGPEAIEFSALSMSSTLPGDVLPDVVCLPLSAGYIPEVVLGATRQHHATVACEGSMFKSTFANVLSAVMAGALGMASRSHKLSVGYGAEVAGMDPVLRDFVKEQADQSLILCRNEPSLKTAIGLGLRAAPGADTAWTLHASPRAHGKRLLRSSGWNGHDAILAVCPMNPFWWPVRPSPQMARELRRTGAHKDRHFGSIFFHAASAEIEGKYRTYLAQLGLAVGNLCRTMSAFPVIVAMDRVDQKACHDLAAIVSSSTAVIVGAEHEVGDVVSALRCSDLLISSRFHALVSAMPAGVPSIGIAMDERIRNLFVAAGQVDRFIPAEAPDLGERLLDAARRLDRLEVERASRQTVGKAIRATGDMGRQFLEEFRRMLPDFPLPDHTPGWQAHVAPLPVDVEAFLSGASPRP
jgi:polysaccharide pyruvyl transferase WcaK-like protein